MNRQRITVIMLLFLSLGLYGQNLILLTPNGGEEWIVGNKHAVHWDWAGTIASVKLEYSTDGGVNWILIASSTTNDGTFLWTIPSTISSNCFVRISSVSNPMINDLSDGSFSIERQSISVKNPDGGEQLVIGESCSIIWDWTGQFNNVKLEYSTDGGSTWTTIIASTPNDGEHRWVIPDFPSTLCRLRVSNVDDPDCYGMSSNNFTISNNIITVIEPDGGESYTVGQVYPVTWDWLGNITNVKIEYSIDQGTTWLLVINSTTNDGSHNWRIPSNPSNNCRIKITNTADPNCFDISDNDFIILQTGLEFVRPNGGESYVVGDICPIHWNWIGTITSVKLEYSIDGGGSWNQITASTNNDGNYNWTVPNIPTTQCRIKITNLADPNCWDISGANFTIENPSFHIVDPDSGKHLVAGETYPIHWDWRGTVSGVKLELWYKTATGVEWWLITASTANDGSHYVVMPSYISDSCGIKITSNDNPTVYDLSEVFSIVRPTMTVIYPNGNEQLFEGNPIEIMWESNGNFPNVMLQYSVDEGQNWQTIILNTPNDGSYYWSVPSGIWPTCLVKVVNTSDIDCYDESDSSFIIIDDAITVSRPKVSDVYYIHRNHPLYWRWLGNFNYVQLRYSTDGGGSWNNIEPSVINKGYYIWDVAKSMSTTALVQVISLQNTGVNDISEMFTMSDTTSLTDSLMLLAPIPNDTFAVGAKCCITWHSLTFSPDQVNLYYSIDNGPWVNITTTANSQRKYEWSVPDFPTDNCRILIQNVSGTMSSISASFSIVRQDIDILYPTAVNEWVVGKKYFILWKWTGDFDFAVIDYSYNGGVDWVNIASPTPNDGEYEWTVPNAPSTQCLVRVRNFENSNVVDISDTFTIKPQTIEVSYPIPSDSFYVGRKYYITWDYTGAFGYVDIEYSIDGGTNWIPVATNVSNTQYYEWTMPNTPTYLAMVRVRNHANLDAIGTSDTFAIVPQTITVTSPLVDDSWIVGRKYYITWWHTGVFPRVTLEYSYDNGTTWNLIKDNESNTRNYEWTIPNKPSDNCFVRVSNYDNLLVYDNSDVFRIPLQTFEVTSPNTGDNLISGRKYYITWTWVGDISLVDIQYSTDNGTTWNYVDNNIANDGDYEWTVPTANSESCLVKLINPQNPVVYDESEMFSIVPQGITITTPIYDDTLITGRKYNITWRTIGSFPYASLWYSVDGGQSWQEIATHVTNSGYYTWSIPETPSDIARIKIGNSDQPLVFSLSDTITLSPPIFEFTSPTLGSVWENSRKYYITWNYLGGMPQVNLYYSSDGGSSWEDIAANQANLNNYEWNVPSGLMSYDCRVRLVSSNGPDIVYVSDSFTIGVTGIAELQNQEVPKAFALQGILPNPFVKQGVIVLALPKQSDVRLILYDVCGRRVKDILRDVLGIGYHSCVFDDKDDNGYQLPRGVYFLKFSAHAKDGEVYEQVLKILKM